MRKIIFSLQLLVFIVPGIAQNKMLSLEDAMVNNRTTLAPDWNMTINSSKIGMNPVTGKIRTIIDKSIAEKQNVEAGSGYVAYLDSFNLFVTDGKKTKQVTSDGSRDIVYASSVHREEFGIFKGTFWSNSGRQLAFYRMDQSMVTDYPIIDWTTTPAHVDLIKYPMAGDKSH